MNNVHFYCMLYTCGFFICHLIGDYILQNQYQADNKTKRTEVAILHGVLYAIPYGLLYTSVVEGWAFIIIAVTHILIDRFRLASYWGKFWGVGQDSWTTRKFKSNNKYGKCYRYLPEKAMCMEELTIAESRLDTLSEFERANAKPTVGWYYEETKVPPFLKVWLDIIGDNTWHLAINLGALLLFWKDV